MAEKKITYVEALDKAIAIEGLDTETKEKLVALKGTLVNKKNKKKPTATQEENVGIKETIVGAIERIGKGTITDIQKADEQLAKLSNQKVSSLVRQLIEEGVVEKSVDKKKSYFALVVVEEDEAETEETDTE